MAEIDLVVFDVDGVLVDDHRSWPAAVAETARRFLGERSEPWVTPGEIVALKAAGGFNSDFDVAAAVVWARRAGIADISTAAAGVAAQGGGLGRLCAALGLRPEPEMAEIAAVAGEVYAGSARVAEMFGAEPQLDPRAEGVWQLEEPLVRPEEILLLPVPKAIYTGRTLGELGVALSRFGFAHFFPDNFRVTCDGPYQKPDGGALVYLAQAAHASSVLMVGDNVDDLRAARHAREMDRGRSYGFCGVGGGALGERAESVFASLGAEAFAPSTSVLLEWLRAR